MATTQVAEAEKKKKKKSAQTYDRKRTGGKRLRMAGSRRDVLSVETRGHEYTAEWTWHTDMHIDKRRHHADGEMDVEERDAR